MRDGRKTPDPATSGGQHGATSGRGNGRRRALACMAWAGAGILWTLEGGVPRSLVLGNSAYAAERDLHAFSFVQISDSHIGFKQEPNPDPAGTYQAAIDK